MPVSLFRRGREPEIDGEHEHQETETANGKHQCGVPLVDAEDEVQGLREEEQEKENRIPWL